VGAARVRVFAVEPTAVQLDWRRLARGAHELAVGERTCAVAADGGPGAVVVDGLEPGRTCPVVLDGTRVATATTVDPPDGPVLARIATLNDLHIGESAIGRLPRCRSSRELARCHAVTCVRGALEEIRAWSPDLLVLKGDLSENDEPREYAFLAEMLEGFPAPIMLLPGNHDGGNHRLAGGPTAVLAGRDRLIVDDVDHLDLPGLRVVGANTVWPGHDRGLLTPRLPQLVEAVSSTSSPVLLTLHHQIMRSAVPTYVPPGLLGREAREVLAAVAKANPATFMTSGHSHRHRVQRHGPLVMTEVGSPKDHPGTWASYTVYASGIVQSVRRIADPDTIRWTEHTGRTALGMWRHWSPGRLADRCFVHHWPPR
jgi:predicted phosphodiesterase